MFKESGSWQRKVEDYENNPVDGIRGGIARRRKWKRQDENLRLYFQNFNQTQPLTYLKRVAHKISTKITM